MVDGAVESDLDRARRAFHLDLSSHLLAVRGEKTIEGTTTPIFSNADGHSVISVGLAAGIAERLPAASATAAGGSASGSAFERAVSNYLERTLPLHSKLDSWRLDVSPGGIISQYAQYAHLDEVQALIRENPELEATIGGDYLVHPDLVVTREPIPGGVLDPLGLSSSSGPGLSPADGRQGTLPILHASISCKWSIRSDRVQNTRTEALNLVRNRKGRTPHIVAVTMEPLPARLASIAVGTGDIDCVYHAALSELRSAGAQLAQEYGGAWENSVSRLEMMVASARLRDISDLPLDLLM